MKNFIFIIILLSFGAVHAQTNEVESLKQANQNLVSAYQNKKFDEALKFAQTALDLSLNIYGAENNETAVAYTNVAAIYREKREFNTAAENYNKALEIYKKKGDKFSETITSLYKDLGDIYFLAGKKKEAEETYLKGIEVVNKAFGEDSKESFLLNLSLANFYQRSKNSNKANGFYLMTYKIASNRFGNESKEINKIDEERLCLITRVNTRDEVLKEVKNFSETRKIVLGEYAGRSGIINAITNNLARPEYPSAARSERLQGTFPVRVQVDTEGNVLQAKAICGNSILDSSAEAASKKSKFKQTLVNGKAISISGILIYNFVIQ